MIKEKYLGSYMKTAKLFAGLSSARRKKVGAIIVKDDRIISIGYNGMPAGWDNNCEDEIQQVDAQDFIRITLKTKPEVLHAELNAIGKLARSNESGEGATMFVTCAPCMDCAKMIYASGIKEVFYAEDYRDQSGLEFLMRCIISVRLLHD
jgi:dCMP deaminase